ncbi:MAG: bifunctional folylpolyglutamate synthase/dihydrofolate synthase [Deltaproteobacteria bacterium]|nr:bifunctional folylpolyglutamate synthase/dihydrofolate synthase [Deltaproteobacteria bacterium]
MDYPALLGELFGLRRFGMELGLERMQRVLGRLGDPQRCAPLVHVAGSNGKGSTAAFTESLLCALGRRPGLFTSPHLLRFTERFRIAGVEASQDAVVAAADKVRRALGEPLTFFEYATAIGFVLFADAGVDCMVIEVGLGGRLDATNAADGAVQVVTGIALDHVAQLGGTLGEIAREKAGIFRAGRTALVALPAAEPGRAEVRAALSQAARAAGARLAVLGEDFGLRPWGGDGALLYHGLLAAPSDEAALEMAARPRFPVGALGLRGAHQRGNAALALAAAGELGRVMGFAVDEEACDAGLATVRWPGRLERVAEAPEVWVDAAHNPDGAAALAAAVRAGDAGAGPLTLVLGALDDKDAAGIARVLAPLAARVIVTRPASPRALAPELLAAALPGADVVIMAAPGAALDAARAHAAGDGGWVLVAGSIFLVASARAQLLGEAADEVAVAEALTPGR